MTYLVLKNIDVLENGHQEPTTLKAGSTVTLIKKHFVHEETGFTFSRQAVETMKDWFREIEVPTDAP